MNPENLPPASNELNKGVCNRMVEAGAPNHIFARYFHDVAVAAMDSDYEIFKLPPDLVDSKPHKLAARLVYDFLKRTELSFTKECVEKEAQNEMFSPANRISTRCLSITKARPPIQKLVRQRYVELMNDQGVESDGWFNIDSEVMKTLSESDSDTTFEIPREAIPEDEEDNRNYRRLKPKKELVYNDLHETVSCSTETFSTNSQQKEGEDVVDSETISEVYTNHVSHHKGHRDVSGVSTRSSHHSRVNTEQEPSVRSSRHGTRTGESEVSTRSSHRNTQTNQDEPSVRSSRHTTRTTQDEPSVRSSRHGTRTGESEVSTRSSRRNAQNNQEEQSVRSSRHTTRTGESEATTKSLRRSTRTTHDEASVRSSRHATRTGESELSTRSSHHTKHTGNDEDVEVKTRESQRSRSSHRRSNV